MSEQLTFGWAGTEPRNGSDAFYLSDQWIKLRYQTLVDQGNLCRACGNTWSFGNPLNVDHIEPRSRNPARALDPDNLQVLCRACNRGKAAWDTTDWRD